MIPCFDPQVASRPVEVKKWTPRNRMSRIIMLKFLHYTCDDARALHASGVLVVQEAECARAVACVLHIKGGRHSQST